MCASCTGDRLAAEIDLLDLEVAVITAEVDAGENWPGAARALTRAEAAAGMRFGELDDMSQQAAGVIARHAGTVRAETVDQLVADLTKVASSSADPYSVLSRLQKLASPASGTSLQLQQVIEEATRQITEVLASTHVRAAQMVVAEAEHQGLAAAALPDQTTIRPTAVQRRQLQVLARQVAEAPVSRVLDVAAREARSAVTPNTEPSAVVQAVDVAVRNISPAGVEDQARQAVTGAVNSGRLAAAQAAPEPREIYASEILDSSTCVPCSHVDGRMYDSMESALTDYPAGGSFRNCLGGSRCRGTLVFVWETEQAPSLDQVGDRPTPRFPVDRTPRGPTTGAPEAAQEIAQQLPEAVGGTLPPPPVPPPNRPPAPGGNPPDLELAQIWPDQYDDDVHMDLSVVRKAFAGRVNAVTKPRGLTWSPSVEVAESGRALNITGVIIDANGRRQGSLHRRLFRIYDESAPGNYTWHVYNEYFTLDEALQGTGLAGELADAMESWYRQLGVTDIRVHANIDVGGYAWARQGFDFSDSVKGRDTMARDLLGRVRSEAAGDQAVLDDVARLEALLDGPADAWPTPYDISRIGWTQGAKIWAGKRGLLGSDWFGIKRL